MKRDQDSVFKKRVSSLERRLENSRKRMKELKQELKALRALIKHKDLILNQMPVWGLMVQDHQVIWASGELLNQLCWKEEEILGREFFRLVHPRSREKVKKIPGLDPHGKSIPRTSAGGPDTYQIHLVTKAGNPVECEAKIRWVRFRARKAFLMGLTPVEAIKEKERERWLAEKHSTCERMALGLVRHLEQCIKGLQRACPEQQGREALSSLDLLMKHLRILGETEPPASFKIFYLPDAIYRAQALFQEKLAALEGLREVEFLTTIRAKSVVKGDPGQISDMLLYLLENSLEAISQRGKIYLSLEEHHGMAWIYIQDNGKGISQDLHLKVFDPYFTTSPKTHLGLGLSLAQAIARRHGGEVLIENCGGHGATFLVKLPLCQKPPSSKRRSWLKELREAKILLISQDNITGDLLCELLKEKGAQVIPHHDLLKAIKATKRKGVDVVLVDLAKMEVEPNALVDQLRKEGYHGAIIFFMGKAEKPSISGLLEKQNITIIVKPFEMQQIFEAIGEAVSRSRGQG